MGNAFFLADAAATWTALGAIIAASAALAALFGPSIRRYFSTRQSERRDQEYLRGWKDDRGFWHTGIIDLTYGWDDDAGHHPGMDDRLRAVESKQG